MSDFNIRADSVNVEQIMEQIRARIREKRGVDYTEQQLRELASVKLEKLIDPRVRSDLVEQFKKRRPAIYEPLVLPDLLEVLEYLPESLTESMPAPMTPYVPGDVPESLMYTFEAETIYETHRSILRFMRRLLNPILKLFFNPNPIIQALHRQGNLNKLILDRDTQIMQRDRQIIDRDSHINRKIVERDQQLVDRDRHMVDTHRLIAHRDQLIVERDNVREKQRVERREMDALYYEVIHNLVFELTRLGVENKNLQMRVESIASRLEFNERRARALESVVQYKPSADADREPPPRVEATPPAAPSSMAAPQRPAAPAVPGSAPIAPEGPGQRSRRRRRRRGRRGGSSAAAIMGSAPAQGSPTPTGQSPASTTLSADDAANKPGEEAAARDTSSAPEPSTDSGSNGPDLDDQ